MPRETIQDWSTLKLRLRFFQQVAQTITLSNTRMPVVPTITVSAVMTLTFTIAGRTIPLIFQWARIIPSLVLTEGDTVIGITGTGRITFTYRKGAL